MALIRKITASELFDLFKVYDRGDNFTIDACEVLVEYFNEQEKDIEVDPIALCCMFTEYGDEREVCEDYYSGKEIKEALKEYDCESECYNDLLNFKDIWWQNLENGNVLVMNK